MEPKFLITKKSGNPVTGPIMVTTSPRITCPSTCAFKGTSCYAEHGFLGGFIWSGLDKTPAGKSFGNNIRVYTFYELLGEVRALPPDTMWRHNQAGDLIPSKPGIICRKSLAALIDANDGRRGFTYTHYDPFIRENYHAILDATLGNFTITLSANDMEHARKLLDLGIASVSVVLPKNHEPPKDVFVCPALSTKGVTCSSCQICTRHHSSILGLPIVGASH